jgi:hypothetical protein
MSLASDWAASMALEAGKVAAAQALTPPACNVNNLNATVTVDGGLMLNREANLSPDEALILGHWIVATYG